MKPIKGTYPEYFETYISLVEGDNIRQIFTNNTTTVFSFLNSIPEAKGDFKYVDNKWSVKEVILHICDAERIFAYRTLRFLRNDSTPLHSFDENEYAKNCNASRRTLKNIIEEFEAVRKSTQLLFESMDETDLQKLGETKAGKVSVLALGFIICGHPIHHMNVIRDRYLR
ncbi:MAG: DinB family protein [Bacteroidetes bacterium]|jgi:uncharacterized damage-inducible protein DinB|nr:DinB family protein [Bacteroidota bacterium]